MPQFRCMHGRLVTDYRECPDCMAAEYAGEATLLAEERLEEAKKQTELLKKLLDEKKENKPSSSYTKYEYNKKSNLLIKYKANINKTKSDELDEKFCKYCEGWITCPHTNFREEWKLYVENRCPVCKNELGGINEEREIKIKKERKRKVRREQYEKERERKKIEYEELEKEKIKKQHELYQQRRQNGLCIKCGNKLKLIDKIKKKDTCRYCT